MPCPKSTAGLCPFASTVGRPKVLARSFRSLSREEDLKAIFNVKYNFTVPLLV